jgi:hypothetical protein
MLENILKNGKTFPFKNIYIGGDESIIRHEDSARLSGTDAEKGMKEPLSFSLFCREWRNCRENNLHMQPGKRYRRRRP